MCGYFNPAPGSYSITIDLDPGTRIELTTYQYQTNFAGNTFSLFVSKLSPAAIYVTPLTTVNSTTACRGSSVSLTVTAVDAPGPFSYSWAAPAGTTLNATSTTAVTATFSATVSGEQTFTVTVGAQNGQLTSTTTVSVSVVPVLSIAATPSLTIGSGQSATLTASGGDTYLWQTGETTAAISVSASGTYSVTGTANGCSAMASAQVSVSVSGPLLAVSNVNTVTIGPPNCPGRMSFTGSGLNFTLTGPGYSANYPVRGGAVNKTISFSGIKTTGRYTVCATGNPGQTPVCQSFDVIGQNCP